MRVGISSIHIGLVHFVTLSEWETAILQNRITCFLKLSLNNLFEFIEVVVTNIYTITFSSLSGIVNEELVNIITNANSEYASVSWSPAALFYQIDSFDLLFYCAIG